MRDGARRHTGRPVSQCRSRASVRAALGWQPLAASNIGSGRPAAHPVSLPSWAKRRLQPHRLLARPRPCGCRPPFPRQVLVPHRRVPAGLGAACGAHPRLAVPAVPAVRHRPRAHPGGQPGQPQRRRLPRLQRPRQAAGRLRRRRRWRRWHQAQLTGLRSTILLCPPTPQCDLLCDLRDREAAGVPAPSQLKQFCPRTSQLLVPAGGHVRMGHGTSSLVSSAAARVSPACAAL